MQRKELKRVWPVYAMPIWLAIIFFLGGGSRHDIESLAILRSLALVVIAVALWFARGEAYRAIRWPMALLVALGAIMIAQLIPLPPEVWSALPGRQLIHELSVAVDLGDVWRPLTISPMKTANSLASLTVPLSVLFLYALLPAGRRGVILPTLVGLGVLSALIGVAQVVLASPSLYFYEITNTGSAVGLFSNRNHNAVFLACATLISLYLAGTCVETRSTPGVLVFLGAALLLAAAVLTNGSRAGFLSLILVWAIALAATLVGFPSFGKKRSGKAPLNRYLLPGALFAAGIAFGALFVFAGRSLGFARLLSGGYLDEMRAELLPVLISMAAEFQPFGVGFGAFEHAYSMVEPVELLGPAYLNNAHHDWLQLVIEGGVPAAIVLLDGLLAAAARASILAVRSRTGTTSAEKEAWLGLAVLVILAIASLVDYPLRVPAIMAIAVLALAKFAAPGLGTRPAE